MAIPARSDIVAPAKSLNKKIEPKGMKSAKSSIDVGCFCVLVRDVHFDHVNLTQSDSPRVRHGEGHERSENTEVKLYVVACRVFGRHAAAVVAVEAVVAQQQR